MRLSNSTHYTPKLARSRSLTFLIIIGILAALLFASGCGTALRVSHRSVGTTGNPASVPGVPFFTKRARCRQEIVWFEPIYTLTLAAMIPDKDGALQSHPRGTLALSRASFTGDEVKVLMKSVSNGADETTVLGNWRKIVPLVDPQVLTRDFDSLKAGDLILLGRSAAPAVFVDYTDQYYVNAKVPLAGSANVDAKVAEDGSLSEASGQVENKTLETILGALPISSVITGELGLGTKNIVPGAVEVFTLTVSISGYRHTLGRLVGYPASTSTGGAPPCPVVNAISLADASDYKREDLSASADSNKGDGKSDTSPKKSSKTEKGKDGASGKGSTAD